MPSKRKPRPRKKVTKTYRRKGKECIKALTHGRPGEYSPKAHNHLVKIFMLAGFTEEETAAHLGISYEVFMRWKTEHESFRQAIIDGGAKADAEIAGSMYERARGYSYNEVTIRKDGKKTITTTSQKQLPADVRAAEIWLRNRSLTRKRWAKTVEDEEPPLPAAPPQITINNQVIDVSKLSDGAIRELIASIKPGEPQPGQA